MYDAEAAQQLEAVVAEEKVHVQRCRETVDDLASHLAGMIAHLFEMGVHVSIHNFLRNCKQSRWLCWMMKSLTHCFFGSTPITPLPVEHCLHRLLSVKV